jgi:MFS family permease
LAYYLTNNVFPGTSRIEYAFIVGLSIGQALLVSPVAIVITRRWGTRTTLLVGVFLETASFIGSSFASQIWHLFLAQGICFGWGIGFIFVSSVGIIPQWFTTKRSLANGIGAAGSGLGGLIYSLAANAMIQHIGLPWAFRTLGIVSFVATFSAALVLKDRNKQVGTKMVAYDLKLFKRYEFWLLLGYGFFSMMGYVVLLYSIANYATAIGLTAKQGSIVGAVLNLGQGLGRPPIGYFSDSFGRINMAGVMTFFCGVLILVVWINAKTFGVSRIGFKAKGEELTLNQVLIFYALLGGTVAGTFWTTVAPVTAEVVGVANLPAALSITWIVLTFPTTCKS